MDTPKTMSAACSNPHPRHRAAAERRVSEHFLVAAIEEVLDAAEELEVSQIVPRGARIPDGVTRAASNRPPNVPNARFDVEHASPAAARGSRRVSRIGRTLASIDH